VIVNLEWTEEAPAPNLRLDACVLARCPASSRGLVVRAVDAGGVLLNGRSAPKGTRVGPGDRVSVVRLLERADPWIVAQPEIPLAVLLEDAEFVALDKPAGVAVHPLAPGETGTLANALAARFPECVRSGDEPSMGGILHRLDGGTSGVILAARTRGAHETIRGQFRRHEVEKTYLAVVEGVVEAGGRVESLLAHTPGDRGKMRVVADIGDARGERAMRAVTGYEPIAAACGRTLLRVRIATGVTHQIRCQLASIGHPIIGDRVYGPDPAGGGFGRHLLHAAEILFARPRDGVRIRVASAAPAEFQGLEAGS
jgi:23S rRNA pseudouridine1911/1915/1917 synthase